MNSQKGTYIFMVVYKNKKKQYQKSKMECTHLGRAVDISPSFVKKLIEDNRNLWMCNGRNLFFSYIFKRCT